jgi:hypothetical protein
MRSPTSQRNFVSPRDDLERRQVTSAFVPMSDRSPQGGGLIAPAVTRLLIAEFADLHPPPGPATALEGLTAREVEVLELVARGELQLRDRVHAVICAYDAGLVTPGGSRLTRRDAVSSLRRRRIR